MKNKHWMIVLLFVALAMAWPGIALAEGGEEDELSGFALFEKLRAMKLEAQSAMVKEDYVEAAKIYRRMARYEKNRARSAAYLLRGADCLMQAKKGHRALEEYTNLLENYPLYVPYEHVVEQLRQLAEWFIVGDGTFLGIKDKDTGIQIYELIIREAPAVQVTLKDRLRLAELLEGSGRGEEAVVVYQAILRQEPGNWDVRAKLALLFLKLSKNGDGDGAKLRAAVREANIVLESNPDNPLAKDLKRLCRDAEAEEAERLLKNGQFYLLPAHRRPTAARRYMHDVIMKYPDSNAAKEARRLLKTNPELRALEEQNAKIDIVPPKTPFAKPQPAPSVKPQPAPSVKPQPAPSIVSKPVAAPKQDPRVAEREKAKKEAERLRQEKELKERQEAEKAKRLKEQEKERQEAEKRAEKLRKAEEAERQKAAEKAAKLKAEREKEEARQHEKEEKARQKRLEEERKERQKQEQKRQENLRREAEKSAKERAKQEDEERSRIEKARQKAEGQLLETSGQAKPGNHVQLVVQDKKKQEESRREAEEELKRIRERNARMLKNDPKLLEEEQKRLKELMEKNRKR